MTSAKYLIETIYLLCLSAFVQSTNCPDRWTSFRGSCYLFAHGGSVSFVEAEHYCNQHAGHLVHINSNDENLFIKDFLRSINSGNTWIGLTDEGTEGLWEWYDTHTSASFTDWYPGEPNAIHGDEDCVAVKSDLDYHWFDDVCSYLKTPLCEMAYDNVDVIG